MAEVKYIIKHESGEQHEFSIQASVISFLEKQGLRYQCDSEVVTLLNEEKINSIRSFKFVEKWKASNN